jgi:ribosomal-protein-alanine N-acetyltransferase
MSVTLRPRAATAEEAAELWPAVRADRLFETAERFAAYRDAAPWRVRVAGRGEASVLGVWRAHLDVLAMRGVWGSPRHVAAFVDDARSVARELGMGWVLSPLLPLDLMGPYRRAGLEICERIVAIQGYPQRVLPAEPPDGVTLREGTDADLPALARLDATSFPDFWVYGVPELAEYARTERLRVATAADGEVIGYTLATVSREAATLGRLAVVPNARRHGLGRALVADVARWALREGAATVSLCTQEENAAARALYAATGLREVAGVYGFAIGLA